MTKTPLVSIIMNCYNGEKYLTESLNSLLKQTYQNWELIFWDNISSDNSKKIFEKYKDERFKYFLSDRHMVLYGARNLAIKKAKGEFLAFGGGGKFALYLDKHFKNGISESSKTFDNEILSKNMNFKCVEIELWCFVHTY